MKTFKEFLLNERIEYQLKVPNSSLEFPVYKIQTKNELRGLLNKWKTLRVLFNGQNAYVWKADEADHSFVKQFISNGNDYFGFMIENNEIVQSFDKNDILVKEFILKYM